jgi:type I restriction enzyme S subunit
MDTGVEWLEKIPVHWQIVPVYARYEVALGKMLDTRRLTGEQPGPYLRNVDVQWDRVNTDALPEMDFSPGERDRYRLRAGDLLICEGGEVGRTAIWRGELDECFYQKAIHRVRPRSERDHPRYFYYVMYSLAARGVFVAGGNPNTIDHLTAVQLRHHRFPFPSTSEQRAIADFLDRETAQTSRLITKKRELVEKLKEKRTALISRTVTCGLPPDAARAAGLAPHPKLKRSEVDWLGDVPEHWDIAKIKHVARIESGHTPSRSVDEYWIDCIVPWVSLNDSAYLRTHDSIGDTVYKINELGIANSSARLLPARAVVFSRDATVGLCAITDRPMAVSQHFVAYLCGSRLLPEYLLLSLKVMGQHLERLSLGAPIPTIGMDDVRSLSCAVPPLAEQRAIVEYLDKERERIDQMITKVGAAIERLREYRVALITAAVTGQIDVRGFTTSSESTLASPETTLTV